MYKFLYSRLSTNSIRTRYLSRAESAIEYSWEPAQKWTPNSPTLVYFYGYDGDISPTNMKHETWNILCLSDRSGLEKKGSWYFGTDGNPWILSGVESLISELDIAGHLTSKNLFFSGKNMGGHAALYFHQKFSGNACLVHNPTTWLIGSKYANKHLQLLDSIFNDDSSHEYNDLAQLANPMRNVFITHESTISHSYFEEQINRLTRSHSLVEVIKSKQHMFAELFTFFHRFEIEAKSPTLSKHQELEYNHNAVSNVSVKLSHSGEFTFVNSIDFSADPYSDRSWRFRLQHLSWLTNHLEQLPGEIRENQLRYIFQSWIDFINNEASGDEFFYHDHSLAYRSVALLKSLKHGTTETIAEIEKHIFEIGQLLVSPLEDNALSNHAFDQAIALFKIADYFTPSLNLEKWKKVALRRIKRELEYSFTPDGVHVENSPAYHHDMITNIHRSLKDVLRISNDETIARHIKGLNKTVPYLIWIIRPDGYLPTIGDSEEKMVSVDLAREICPEAFLQTNEGMKVFGKGYAIWRSEEQQFHMTLKSCNHGRFHRHDDDCSITLWKQGQNIFYDSGLLYYKEKDPNRIYVRSAAGHSGFEIPNRRAFRDMFVPDAQKSAVTLVSDNSAIATLGMYGRINANRTVMASPNKIIITDVFSKAALNVGIQSNFIIDEIWNISHDDTGIYFEDANNKKWSISIENLSQVVEFKVSKVFVSAKNNEKKLAKCITLVPKREIICMVIDLKGV